MSTTKFTLFPQLEANRGAPKRAIVDGMTKRKTSSEARKLDKSWSAEPALSLPNGRPRLRQIRSHVALELKPTTLQSRVQRDGWRVQGRSLDRRRTSRFNGGKTEQKKSFLAPQARAQQSEEQIRPQTLHWTKR
jgi:hypothetical protein